MDLTAILRRPAFGRPALVCAVLAVVAAVGIAAREIQNGSADVIYADTWGYLRLIDTYLSGQLSFGEILNPHNENRSILLCIVLLASAEFDNFNQNDIEYLSLVFVALTLSLLIYTVRPFLRARPLSYSAAIVAVALLLFSLNQWENLLLSINVVFFASIAFATASIVVMARFLNDPTGPRAGLLLALAAALSELSLFSMGGGIVVWPANIAQMIVAIWLFKARVRAGAVIYAAVGFVSIVAYVYALPTVGDWTLMASRPLDALEFFVIGSGNSIVGFFSNEPRLALDFAVGLCLILIYAYAAINFFRLSRDQQRNALVWVALIAFGLMEQALIVSGRLQFGAANGATARYSTLTLISPAAAVLFFTHGAAGSRVNAVIACLLVVAVAAFSLIGDQQEGRIAGARMDYVLTLRDILVKGEIGPEEGAKLEWSNLSDIRDGNQTLRRYRLSLYHKSKM